MRSTSISIITPSYNQAQYLEQTINSVLSQNYPNIEYIIIDGGSTDGSIEIIKKYQKHLAYWISEPDHGQSHAINKGVTLATGELINWLNSDDYLEPGALKYISKIFSDPSVKTLCAKANHVNDGEVVKISNGTDVYFGNLAKTIGWARFDQPETWFRRSAWEKVGFLDTSLNFLMDREWWIRYLTLFGLDGIVQSDRVIVNFRLHESSKTVSQSSMFQKDHDAFFYQLAKISGFNEIANQIRNICLLNERYILTEGFTFEQKMVTSILNYYLLHRAHEFYFQKSTNHCSMFLNTINPHLLDEECLRLYRKLTFRNLIQINKLKKVFRAFR